MSAYAFEHIKTTDTLLHYLVATPLPSLSSVHGGTRDGKLVTFVQYRTTVSIWNSFSPFIDPIDRTGLSGDKPQVAAEVAEAVTRTKLKSSDAGPNDIRLAVTL